MPYVCELGTGQRVYLDNQGGQTLITTASGAPGQQQQSSSGFQTGNWTSPPSIYRTGNGIILKIETAQGEHFVQLQGSSMSVMGQTPSLGSAQQMSVQQVSSTPASSPSMEPMKPMEPMQMEPMQPMQPMQPMKMGDMEMGTNPMQMRMGNMEMKMGGSSSSSSSSSSGGTRRFCNNCGASVKPDDRFCGSCGHQLN
ncbi:zinc ribbon domain-containing protein [Lyngbya sp. CCY1209]|uniref:zinc ribbon domain-containing protein n=1 Tax=Lyngbya sp. CCY1209 TaxID=2886103 RepID=UPI002D211062|nr:zinc ribbon domain-containing protein [Lyngbya sp. CCY1209]MEB3885133.1 zinc ribbon domain-containing protein [Lyngbya sp. CCY1209]